MYGLLFQMLIYMIPLMSIVFFIVSLVGFLDAKKKYKAEPNEENAQKKNATKTIFIVSAVIMGVLLAIIIGFMALMYMAVAYM